MCKIMCSYVVKNKNVKVFNLLSKTNETKNIKWNETCKCKSRLHRNVITNNARIMRNADPNVKNCLVNGSCDRGFIWNPSNCECECDKLCVVGEYLDYKNCKDKK